MENFYRNNSKLVEADSLPINQTVSRYQMCLPLVHQPEIPDDKEKCDWDEPERGGSCVTPQLGGPCEP